jgi:membrane fusion protein (multidrug efflux system)
LLQASFDNPKQIVRPGQFARVRAIFDIEDDVVMITQRCVTELQGRFLVNLVGEGNVLEGLQLAREGVTISPVPAEFEIIQEKI